MGSPPCEIYGRKRKRRVRQGQASRISQVVVQENCHGNRRQTEGEKTEENMSWRRRAKSGLRERAVTIRRINLEIKSLRNTAETIKRKMDIIEKHSNSRDKVRSRCYLAQQQVESDNREKKAAIKAENIRRNNEESLRFERRFIAASKRLNLFDSIIEEMTEDENKGGD